jgi:hypothetical protein
MGSRKKDDIKSNTWTTGTTEKEEKKTCIQHGLVFTCKRRSHRYDARLTGHGYE